MRLGCVAIYSADEVGGNLNIIVDEDYRAIAWNGQTYVVNDLGSLAEAEEPAAAAALMYAEVSTEEIVLAEVDYPGSLAAILDATLQ